ncbi:MAG TPA: DEAD/DEAH box helicase [Propionibacteriaceae bacterium]|nr:DEAD/DEAH box helicase [Propionibacteriaceae bacterium]
MFQTVTGEGAAHGAAGSGRVAVLLEVLAGGPLDEAALLDALRLRWPQLRPARLASLLDDAGAAVRQVDGRWQLAAPAGGPAAEERTEPSRPLRAVAFDLEALVRPVASAPYLERAIWQVGAVRFGTDRTWVNGEGRFVRWVELPEGFDFADPATAAAHPGRARPAGEVYAELLGYCADADVLVAYNGTGMDFGVLDAALATVGLARPAAPVCVDGLYLAYCFWPAPPDGHRLRPLAEAVGVDVTGLHWHDAGDDAELLARLLAHGARTVVGAWEDAFADVIGGANASSPAWRLAFELAGRTPPAGGADDAAVAAALGAALAGRQPRRGRPAPPPLAVPGAWLDGAGRVDPYLLSASINPRAVRRAAQDQMTSEVRAAIADGVDLAVEAATGTGKSLAALAAGIDWLAGGLSRRVVIATHTKQLQRQLAADIDALAVAAPALLAHTNLVKGAANRLSLRALVGLLADLGAPRRTGVLAEVAFGELVTYLTCRLVTPVSGLLAEAELSSVDTADVPAFFEDYTARRWGAYLTVMSQAAAGDYEAAGGLGDHTVTVAEALAATRLVVANHALVFSHLDDLERYGDDTLLIVDEAHALEGAATEALGFAFDYPALEVAARQLNAWARRADAGDAVVGCAARLEDLLQRERIAKAAMDAADALAGPIVDGRPRSAALVSPFTGDSGAVAVRRLLSDMGGLARALDSARKAMGGWMAANRAGASRRDVDRAGDLRSRLAALADAAAGVVGDADLVGGTSFLVPPAPAAGPAGPGAGPVGAGGGPAATGIPGGAAVSGAAPAGAAPGGRGGGGLDDLDADSGGAAGGLDDGPPEDASPDDSSAEDANPDDGGPDGVGHVDAGGDGDAGPLRPGNRVIWLAEQAGSQLAGSARGYRFGLRSSPIRLSSDAGWVRFRSLFATTVLTSATLTVAGGWDYLADRLGLVGIRAIVLAGPFDYARQARLVCFSDFPSWAEHTEAAMRSVAWQLAGYGVEADAAGRTPGAIVLTTATATAAGIAEHLGAYSAAAGLEIPLAAAPVLGNARAVDAMRERGGWLVGTKGLWAGVDIAEPDRARICWINKLPFAPFADPVVAARRAEVAARAEAAGHPDPDQVASEEYYLPLAAIELRQAVGRLIRSSAHRGVIVISDRKLAGSAARRRTYRRILLGSLDPGLLVAGPGGDVAGGNVTTMADGWARIWEFLAGGGDIDPARLRALCDPAALDVQTLLPETRAIRAAQLTGPELAAHRAAGTLEATVAERAATIGGLLRFSDVPVTLKPEQVAAVCAVARGDDLLALLPTGFGKSFCFQLPALALPGVTVVVSPLVALMADQAMELNRSIGGAVRALVAPMAESSSRAGRQEVAEQLTGAADHGIRLIYVSPERFAQRQFREWVSAAAADGRLARVVIDEAHTATTWTDFRPSFSRFTSFLADLRAGGVPVSALTATANRTVREGLRRKVFDLPAVPDPARPDPPSFCVVEADPIRPELALYRFALTSAGPVSLARYLEAAYDAASSASAPGHAIFYCLTVREVNATWAHLRDYAGPAAAARIRRFHGRLSEAEKASVLGDFRDAPRPGDEDFAPLVVVATSAFGLGINRGDVANVFVTSPPTDIAALYQQLGRAGRDKAGTIPAEGDSAAVGVSLATARGFRTVEFITRDLPPQVLEVAGRAVLGCTSGVLDATAAAEALIAWRVHAGQLTMRDALSDVVASAHRSAVVRAMAALDELGALDDLGDFPATVALTPGEAIPDPADDPAGVALVAWVAAQGAAAKRASVLAVHAALSGADLVDAADPAATWAALIEAHHSGILDVSQAPNRRWLTALALHTNVLPAGYREAVTARVAAAAAELKALRDWYGDTGRCANQGIADYFSHTGHGVVPAGTCTTSPCRCSSHWANATSGTRPAMFEALLHPPARPASASDDRARAARLDADVARLLADNPYGLGPRSIYYCLRGKERVPDGAGGLKPLRSTLYYHRLFGSRPALRWPAVQASLARLEAAGTAVAVERRWRSAAAIAAEAARAARQAAQAAPAGASA